MTIDWTMFAFGCLGGLLPDAIRLAQDRYKVELPAYWRRWKFWIGLVVLVLLGGVAAVLWGAQEAKVALAFGFAGPEVISRAFSSDRPAVQGDGDGLLSSMRRWWSF